MEPDYMVVRVVEGHMVKDPEKRFIDMKPGIEYRVPCIQYWFRRLRDGDVVEVSSHNEESKALESKEKEPKPRGRSKKEASE